MTELSIIGFGGFGKFMVPHLRSHFSVHVADARSIPQAEVSSGVVIETIEAAAACPIVVLAVPVQNLEELLMRIAPHVTSDALVIDVSSVKMRPRELMLRHLPSNVRVVGTHPLFGPQSGAEGIEGLPIAFYPARCDNQTAACVRRFLAATLGLEVIDTTPEAHDREMAHVQGLTHLISRALGELSIPNSPMATVAYRRLLSMRANLQHDSMDLFMTIERENPFAGEVRRAFLEKISDLERRIGDGRQGVE